jgi:hypothetical protein
MEGSRGLVKVTVEQICRAGTALKTIVEGKRLMPMRGKFLLARLYGKLLPELMLAEQRRNELIASYETAGETPGSFTVPHHRIAEFTAAMTEMGAIEIEVDVEPVAFADLDLGAGQNGGVEVGELIALGDFVLG